MYDSCAQWYAHRSEQFWNLHVSLGLDLVFCVYVFVSFCFTLDQFIPVLFAFVVLGLVSSASSQKIVWEERLRNELFCVSWDAKL